MSVSEIARLLGAVQAYAVSHGGKYPPSLEALAEDGFIAMSLLTYDEGQKRYGYVAGLSERSNPRSVVLYEVSGDQDHNRYVARLGGAVELLGEQEFETVVGR